MRLFVALTLSPDARAALMRAQDALKKQGRGNFSREENLHLTLAFLGETDRMAEACAALHRVESPPFTVKLEGLGAFDDLVWAGVALSPALKDLQKEVAFHLKESGFSLEKRAFRPHITLCRRFAPFGARDLAAVQRAMGSARSPVRGVVLMESLRIEGKLTYRPVAVQKL